MAQDPWFPWLPVSPTHVLLELLSSPLAMSLCLRQGCCQACMSLHLAVLCSRHLRAFPEVPLLLCKLRALSFLAHSHPLWQAHT